MNLPSNYYWEKRDSNSIPGHTLHQLHPAFGDRFAIVLYHREEGKWLYSLPFGGTSKPVVKRADWSEMPSEITSLEEAKAYVETLWRME